MSEKLTGVILRNLAAKVEAQTYLTYVSRRAISDALFELATIREREEAAPEPPFRITGPGRYRQRNGEVATIDREDGSGNNPFPWEGKRGDGYRDFWRRNGMRNLGHKFSPYDLVAHADPLQEDPAPQPEPVAEVSADTALWDQCAIAVYAAWAREHVVAHRALARDAFNAADAFMAERKARKPASTKEILECG